MMDSNSKAMQWVRVAIFAVVVGVLLGCALLSFYGTVVISEDTPPTFSPVDSTYPHATVTPSCSR